MIDPDYADAVSGAGGGSVCGYRLFHLTPRHVLGLSMVGSPFVSGGVVDFADVLIAARILGARNERQWRRAVLGGGRIRGFFLRVSVFCRAAWYGRKWWKCSAELRQWLDAEMIVPDVMKGDNEGRKLSSPWLQVMVCRLARECGCDLPSAWWMRFSDAAWGNVAWQEIDGAEIRLMDAKLKAELMEMGWEESEL